MTFIWRKTFLVTFKVYSFRRHILLILHFYSNSKKNSNETNGKQKLTSNFLKAYFRSLNEFATLTGKVVGRKQWLTSCCCCCCFFCSKYNLHNFATANLRKCWDCKSSANINIYSFLQTQICKPNFLIFQNLEVFAFRFKPKWSYN